MRRWLAILLLSLLPLQLGWAAVSVYCQHETGAAAQHFGHHDHQHHAGDDLKDDNGAKTLGSVDADCPVCHAGCATALSTPAVMPVFFATGDMRVSQHALPSSPPPSLPERPNWVRLA